MASFKELSPSLHFLGVYGQHLFGNIAFNWYFLLQLIKSVGTETRRPQEEGVTTRLDLGDVLVVGNLF